MRTSRRERLEAVKAQMVELWMVADDEERVVIKAELDSVVEKLGE